MELKTLQFLFLSSVFTVVLHAQVPFSLERANPPVTEVLKPVWTQPLESKWGYTFPNTYEGVVFPNYPNLFFDCEKGEPSVSFSPSERIKLLYTYKAYTKSYVEITNPSIPNMVMKIRNGFYNISEERQSSIFKDDIFYLKGKDELMKYIFKTDSLQFIAKLEIQPKSSIIADNNQFYYSNGNKIFIGNISTGKITDEVVFDNDIFRIKRFETLLFFWVRNVGLYCFDMKTNKVLWNFKPKNTNIGHIDFVVEECLYLSAGNLYCLDIFEGNLYWKTEGNCSEYGQYIRIIGDYVLQYNTCTIEGTHYPALIELLDKKTGDVRYQGWTSEFFPTMDEQSEVSLMDFHGPIIFANDLCGDMLIGIRGNMIYGFRLDENKKE